MAGVIPNVFGVGKYTTELMNIEPSNTPSNSNPPPKPLLVATPTESGDFPVLLFLHGYMFRNSFYSQLIQHIASHGFIVIAPQLYVITLGDAVNEVQHAADVTNWLSDGLHNFLPFKVQPNLKKLGLAGHSRGGKVAFALALGLTTATTDLKFSALIGVDPVDGKSKRNRPAPLVLNYKTDSFDLDMTATMVIGTGLGDAKRNGVMCPCAPKDVSHVEFYNECGAPACHLVAKDYGHCDMLDDETKGTIGKMSYCMCKNGKARKPMREFVGGAVVAFLRGYLQGDMSDLMGIKDKPETAPVELEPVEFKEKS